MGQESAWGCPDRGSWSAGGKWPQRRTAPAHAPITVLTLYLQGPELLQQHHLRMHYRPFGPYSYCVLFLHLPFGIWGGLYLL